MFSQICRASRPLATRSFAAAAEGKVTLPIQLYGLPARYANAVYVAAAKKNSLEAVEKDLTDVRALIDSTPVFKEYLENPIISRKHKVEDVEKIAASMNPLTRSLLCVLAENGRLNEIEKVAATYDQLMNASRGLVEAKVVSAQPLKGDEQKKLNAALNSLAKEGEKLKIEQTVNPEIIGGLQVQIGDRFIDLSIQSKINKMWKMLGETKQ